MANHTITGATTMFRVPILCFFLFSSYAYSGTTLTFNRPTDTPQSRYVIELITLIYKDLGYKIKIIDFNHQSALVAANEGELDGQLGRIDGVSKQYPALLKINHPMLSFNLLQLSYCQDCDPFDAEAVVVQSGYLAPERFLQKNGYKGNVIKIKSNSALLNLLIQNKVNTALVIDFHIKTYKDQLDALGITAHTLDTIELYHYLHKKHEHLIPLVIQSLKKAKEEGLIDLLKQKYAI